MAFNASIGHAQQVEPKKLAATLFKGLKADEGERAFAWIGFANREERILAIEKAVDSNHILKGFTLWEYGLNGDVVRQTPVSHPPAGSDILAAAAVLAGAVVLPGDEILVVGSFEEEGRYSVLKFDAQRKLVFSKPLEGDYSASRLYKTAFGPDDSILVLGSSGHFAKAVAIAFDGTVLWRRDYAAESEEGALQTEPQSPPVHAFTDVAVSSNGETILFVGQTGEATNKFGLGPMDVWLVRCDGTGKLIDEHRFPGRSPNIAGRFSEKQVVVLYDSQSEKLSEHVLVALDSDFKKLWSSTTDISGVWVYPPDLVKASDGQYILAGLFEDEMRVREYDASGRLAGSVNKQVPGVAAGSPQVITKEGKTFIAIQLLATNQDGSPKEFGEIYRVDGAGN